MNQNFFELIQNFLKNPEAADAVRNSFKGVMERGKQLSAEGAAGGDMVRVTMNGNFEVTAVKLDPIVVDRRDVAMLEQLLVSACCDAGRKVREQLGNAFGGNFPV